MTHWIEGAAARGGLLGTDRLDIPHDATTEEAWTAVEETLGVSALNVAMALASAFSMPIADLSEAEPTAERFLTGSVARKFGVFPIEDQDRFLVIATSNPVDAEAEQAVGFASGRSPRFAVAPPGDIARAIEGAYSADVAAESLLSRVDDNLGDLADIELDTGMEDEVEQVSMEEIAAGPIVKLTNIIIHEAVARGASDIHIQPLAGQGLVRFRSDGVLHNGMQMPLPVLTRVISRIKIMARLDITDRLRPQDGRARILVGGKKYDLRVSTVPTRSAEKAVIRILDTQGAGTLAETGIHPEEITRVRHALAHRDGILVVTGPTGSGKTTTLYGALREISTEDVNIMTVEDPVEYELPRLTQIQVEHKQGMTFASALRAILRQDPDVIFVGEIRDVETAEIAAQASLTGHLVLATLHTNDAVGSLRRFLDLGLDSATVGETLRGALAQRLVRRVCRHCAETVQDDLTDEEADLAARFGRQPTVRAKGCDQCVQQGYMGRLPVTEFMVSTPALVRLLLDGAPPFELQQQAMRDGMITMLQSALRRVDDGETTLQEVDRVVGGTVDPAHLEPPPPPAIEPTPVMVVATQPPAPAAAAPPPSPPIPEPVAVEPVASAPVEVPPQPVPTPPPEPAPPPEPEAAPELDEPTAPPTHPSRQLMHAPAGEPTLELAEIGGGMAVTGQAVGVVDRSSIQGLASLADESLHILLVDDDEENRALARGVLASTGAHFSESGDGADALLRFARGERFSLMLLDLEMPVMGGKEVLQAVRRSMVTASLPVVVLTGTRDQGAERELLEMGADDYLKKPIDPGVLAARVHAVLHRSKG